MCNRYDVFLFIDAIDELDDREELLDALNSLLTCSEGVKVFVTSRSEVQLSERLPCRTVQIGLEAKVTEMDRDISLYINGRLRSDRRLAWPNSGIGDDISQTLQSKSVGMCVTSYFLDTAGLLLTPLVTSRFRWAQCQLDSIARARTIREVRRTLASLPQGLDETYNRILVQIPETDEDLFRKLLVWLAFSFLPLTLEELWEAIAIEPGSSSIDDESRLRSPQDLMALGHSLISVTTDGHVRLAHLSVRDYLLSNPIRQHPVLSRFALDPSKAHDELARDCLTYLEFGEFRKGPCQSDTAYCDRIKRHPLARYVSTAWSYHIRFAQQHEQQSSPVPSQNTNNDTLHNLSVSFFSPFSRPTFMSWIQILNADSPFKWNLYPRHATPLYYASSFGLTSLVSHLLSSLPSDNPLALTKALNSPGSRFGGTAVHAATIRHHLDIMDLLLSAGADPARGDFNNVTPLHSAASQGNMQTIRVLLRYGAPLTTRDALAGKTPAEWAAMSGEMKVAAFLMQFPAEGEEIEDRHGQEEDDEMGLRRVVSAPALGGSETGLVARARGGGDGKIKLDLSLLGAGGRVQGCGNGNVRELNSGSKTGSGTGTGTGTGTGIETRKHEVLLWKPRSDYFPDTYDKRSGLFSSILVGFKSGDREVAMIEGEFSPEMITRALS